MVVAVVAEQMLGLEWRCNPWPFFSLRYSSIFYSTPSSSSLLLHTPNSSSKHTHTAFHPGVYEKVTFSFSAFFFTYMDGFAVLCLCAYDQTSADTLSFIPFFLSYITCLCLVPFEYSFFYHCVLPYVKDNPSFFSWFFFV